MGQLLAHPCRSLMKLRPLGHTDDQTRHSYRPAPAEATISLGTGGGTISILAVRYRPGEQCAGSANSVTRGPPKSAASQARPAILRLAVVHLRPSLVLRTAAASGTELRGHDPARLGVRRLVAL